MKQLAEDGSSWAVVRASQPTTPQIIEHRMEISEDESVSTALNCHI
jgi:hypothetical protein